MLCHSIYLQVVKARITDESLHFPFVLPSENQNSFRLLSICANAVYNVIQSLKDISSVIFFFFFCKDIHETLKYVDELSELKNDEIQKEHASLSLSTCRSIESTQNVIQKPMRTIKWGFQYISISVDIVRSHARIQRGDRGSGPPPPT